MISRSAFFCPLLSSSFYATFPYLPFTSVIHSRDTLIYARFSCWAWYYQSSVSSIFFCICWLLLLYVPKCCSFPQFAAWLFMTSLSINLFSFDSIRFEIESIQSSLLSRDFFIKYLPSWKIKSSSSWDAWQCLRCYYACDKSLYFIFRVPIPVAYLYFMTSISFPSMS